MITVIDNYDSFTYNLVHYLQILGQEVQVFLHDQITVKQIEQLKPSHLIISPGPNSPKEAGISVAAIQYFQQKMPILGVCLGHQSIAYAFGGHIIRAPQIIHGKSFPIFHNKQGLFQDIPNYFQATRYHSLAVECASLPTSLQIDAWTDSTIMAISHREYPIFGLQFHPEAILSEYGLEILQNFLRVC